MKKRIRNFCLYLVLVLFLIFLDQLTKYLTLSFIKDGKDIVLIPRVLTLTYVKNTGALFGMMSDSVWLFCLLTPFMMLVLGWIYFQVPADKKFWPARLASMLMMAGGIGNLIDRIRLRYVVDMIYFVPINFPVFNVADCYVTLGVFGFALMLIFWKELGERMFPDEKKKA